MASTVRLPTIPTIRHLLRQPLPNPRLCQRRYAQVQDVRYLATHGTQERILAKYRSKLETKAKSEGLSDISELKEAYKDKIERLRKEAAIPGATAPLTPPPSPTIGTNTSAGFHPPPPPPHPHPHPHSAPSTPPPPPGIKTLHSFLDVPKILPLPQKEIQTLWRLRHASNPQSLHFSLPSPTFASLLQTAKKHPAFVLPLPRQIPAESSSPSSPQSQSEPQTQQAAELHYLQFAHPHPYTTTLLFTSLAEFKLRGEYASPHTTITFHSELADSHGLVLGQGIVVENRGVSVDEARWLVMCMQKFYVVGDEGHARGDLLEMFTRGDGGFRVERLLEEAEKIV
ncbi:ATP11 protein-domain-containing protein [Clohesyomyces aquaticus]|uniref:ATP11 protein-domain-containing protein n=1 Tax=Clohesyomyces aquaticus TaxID=1231657 RepID=A0A1Y1YQC6_9PLEO|nr:ATP11 protein-domain-containing protein [Clohesyomyces aquaticus]